MIYFLFFLQGISICQTYDGFDKTHAWRQYNLAYNTCRVENFTYHSKGIISEFPPDSDLTVTMVYPLECSGSLNLE
jgi:hypothetical protein